MKLRPYSIRTAQEASDLNRQVMDRANQLGKIKGTFETILYTAQAAQQMMKTNPERLEVALEDIIREAQRGIQTTEL